MTSESVNFTRIFFKDKKNELKGPYSERQVQEWYREGWFEGSFPFYFLEQGRSPDESSCSFTLDELLTRNGIGAPFSLPTESLSSDKIRDKTEQRLNCIEEEIRSLRVKCDGVLRVKERLGKMDEKIKSLPTQLLQSTNTAAAYEAVSTEDKNGKKTPKTVKKLEKRDKKREAELSEFNKLTDFYSDFYIAFVDALQSKHYETIKRDYRRATVAQANCIIVHKEMRPMLIEKIIGKMKERDCIECAHCELFVYTYKQWFIHLGDLRHIQKEELYLIPNLGEDFVRISFIFTYNYGLKLTAEEEIFSKAIAKKYASVSLDESRMLPNTEFADYVHEHYTHRFEEAGSQAMTNGKGDEIILRTSIHGQMLFGCIMAAWFKDLGLGAELMAEMDAHIGTGLTYCVGCKMVTGTREEYYKHLLLYSHLKFPCRHRSIFPSIAVSVIRADLID